ncbi:Uncharacterised protein [Vibrio cholerae]|uniref:Uncharacterized protein n=1 Tax=Vibrio cholerae TaxID=666 RepID=A0A655TQL0_VIBCL|nr:Uncharacterised protein [Vibrio cholerae]CSC31231.1 Uncharacterised protein [Vibrio cholerae]CSD34374.1 Uncharacterised protein [Vibrio cholerae]
MPILTTSVIALPVKPFHSPPITRSEKAFILANTAFTAGITSSPFTNTGELLRLRSAVCSTARSSVWLIASPLNIAVMADCRSVSLANANKCCIVSAFTRFFE